jgi:DNA-binding CsgD family transcriptional regulator
MTVLNQNWLAIGLFGLTAIFVGVDLLADAGSGTDGIHLAMEGAATVLALAGAAFFFRRYLAERAESAHWRGQAQDLLAGVGSSIESQLQEWALSPAESEVAVLLLKGLSFKEIAAVRSTGERTAREQARAVYKKAGVAGRAELSAWFLEDLLPPSGASDPQPSQIRDES